MAISYNCSVLKTCTMTRLFNLMWDCDQWYDTAISCDCSVLNISHGKMHVSSTWCNNVSRCYIDCTWLLSQNKISNKCFCIWTFPSSAKRTHSVTISFSISLGTFLTMRCPIFMKKNNKRRDVFKKGVPSPGICVWPGGMFHWDDRSRILWSCVRRFRLCWTSQSSWCGGQGSVPYQHQHTRHYRHSTARISSEHCARTHHIWYFHSFLDTCMCVCVLLVRVCMYASTCACVCETVCSQVTSLVTVV